MRMYPVCFLTALIVFGLGTAHGDWGGDWDFPTPETQEHPDTEAAPVSSPETYPDAEGFSERAYTILNGLADNDLMTWRRGYFEGGDPGKYLPGHAMAKLLIGDGDPLVRELYNDDRSHGEHYHFAAHNWARFLPIFGQAILSDETKENLAEAASTYSAYHSGGGTENHVTQWRTAAAVMPHFLQGDGTLGHRSKDDVLAEMKEWLRNYVQGIYAAGNGEWDSSTYIMYTMNGLQSIYDFSPDEEMRLMARAGLDWFAAAYALKYRGGIFTGPNQRGHADAPHDSIADQTGYLWWGSNADITADDTGGWRYTLHPITSGWRPNRIITDLAQKRLPELPAEFRNTKAGYWGTEGEPEPHEMPETVYVSERYTMGSLWQGSGGQITRFQIVAETPEGAAAFTGGHPAHFDHNNEPTDRLSWRDGNGNHDQSAQVGSAYINLVNAPPDEDVDFAFFAYPRDIESPQRHGEWFVMEAEGTYVAVRPMGTEGELDVGGEDDDLPIIRLSGRQVGFLVETSDVSRHDSLEAFAADVEQLAVDDSAFADELRVSFTNLDGQEITAAWGDGIAAVTVDGQALDPRQWDSVYDGRYLRQRDGVLEVNNGEEGFVVDFTGELPEYRSWSAE